MKLQFQHASQLSDGSTTVALLWGTETGRAISLDYLCPSASLLPLPARSGDVRTALQRAAPQGGKIQGCSMSHMLNPFQRNREISRHSIALLAFYLFFFLLIFSFFSSYFLLLTIRLRVYHKRHIWSDLLKLCRTQDNVHKNSGVPLYIYINIYLSESSTCCHDNYHGFRHTEYIFSQ